MYLRAKVCCIFVRRERDDFPEREASGVALEEAAAGEGSAKRADADAILVAVAAVADDSDGGLLDVGDAPEEFGNDETICRRSVCLDGCP